MEVLLARIYLQLNQMVSKGGVIHNLLKLLQFLNRNFVKIRYKSLYISKLSLIARPGCGRFILAKQTSTQTRSLACLPYTKSLPISKTNLPTHAKAMNAAVGSFTQSWLSWCRLLHRKRRTFFDVLIHFSEPSSIKSVITPSWLHPRYPGIDYGKGFGA